jgi:hypothetical protein
MAKLSHAELVPKRRHQAGFVVSATELPRCGAATATCTPRRNPTSATTAATAIAPAIPHSTTWMASAKSARTNCGITLLEPRPCERAEEATWYAWAEGTPCAISPAWALTQGQVLETAGIAPPSVELEETDLNATRWVEQGNVDWILITPSLVGSHRDDVSKPLQPEVLVPLHPAVEPRPSADAGCCPVRPYGAHGRPASRMEAAAWTSTPRHAVVAGPRRRHAVASRELPQPVGQLSTPVAIIRITSAREPPVRVVSDAQDFDGRQCLASDGVLARDTSNGLTTYERGTNGCALTLCPAEPSRTMR